MQKGPSFPHPIDLSIDTSTGQVTARSIDEDAKGQVTTDHLDLPTDLATITVPYFLVDPTRSDPQFAELVRNVGLPQQRGSNRPPELSSRSGKTPTPTFILKQAKGEYANLQ